MRVPAFLGAVSILICFSTSFSNDLPGSCPVDRETWSKRTFQSLRVKPTEDEMRGIAAAIECYGTEHNAFPIVGPKLVALSRVETDLVPRYRSFIPTTDSWGAEYLYWSNGSHYVLISTAADALSDHDYDALLRKEGTAGKSPMCHGAIDDPEKDLVIVDGQFCSWFKEE